MSNIKQYWKWAAAFVLGVTFLALVNIAESWYQRYEAGRLIAALSGIQVGSTTEARAREITKRFSRYNVRNEFPKDPPTSDSDKFGFRNRAFPLLHLAPAKWVWITLDYKNGFVVEKSAQYFEEPRCGGVITEIPEPTASTKQTVPSGGLGRDVLRFAVLCHRRSVPVTLRSR